MQEEVKSCYLYLDTGDSAQIVARYSLIDSRYEFLYGKSYLGSTNGFPIDPLHLPFLIPNRPFYAPRDGFGVIADATPDAWGRKLTMSMHRRTPLNQIEWLIASKGHGVGCLVASLSQSWIKKHKANLIQFDELREFISVADAVEHRLDPSDMNFQDQYLLKLIENGSSMGGARPKTLVMHQGKEWIAKLNRSDDLFDTCRVEYASLKMAQALGLNVCNVELVECGNRSVLLVERFDRNCPERKKHYISSFSLAHIQSMRNPDPRVSYMAIAKQCSQICHDPIAQQKELYKRMVFNVMINNTDDHLKNHGFLMYDMTQKLYALSPLFDVLPHGTGGTAQEHALMLGEFGRTASLENVRSRINAFGLTSTEATQVIDEVRDVVANRNQFLKDAGLQAHEIKQLDRFYLQN